MSESVIITLPDPIPIDGDELTSFSLTRQPTGKDLGPVTVMQLIDGDRRALGRVIPRISVPRVEENVVKTMTMRNLLALSNGVAAFLEGTDFDSLVTKTTTTSSKTKTDPSSSQKA